MPHGGGSWSYLIFVTSTTSGACGEKICHVEKFFHMTDGNVEKFLHMRNVKKIYRIDKILRVINVEQNVFCGEMWRNLSSEEIFHMTDVSTWVLRNMEQVCYVDRFHHMTDFSTGAIKNEKLICFVAKSLLSPSTLFCREICFVAIYALLYVQKLNQKLCSWRKKDKYQVCITLLGSFNEKVRINWEKKLSMEGYVSGPLTSKKSFWNAHFNKSLQCSSVQFWGWVSHVQTLPRDVVFAKAGY